jgi:hypothetical protein
MHVSRKIRDDDKRSRIPRQNTYLWKMVNCTDNDIAMAFQNFEMAFNFRKFADLFTLQPRAGQVINLSSSSSRIVTQIPQDFILCRSSSFLSVHLCCKHHRIVCSSLACVHPYFSPKPVSRKLGASS